MANNQFSVPLIQLAKCWNHLDTSYVREYLSDNLVYDSQWVLENIMGKDDYLTYLEPKLEAIRVSRDAGKMVVVAELASLQESEFTPIIVLTQVQTREVVKISVLVEVVANKIKHISFCAIPDPSSAFLSGIVPF